MATAVRSTASSWPTGRITSTATPNRASWARTWLACAFQFTFPAVVRAKPLTRPKLSTALSSSISPQALVNEAESEAVSRSAAIGW